MNRRKFFQTLQGLALMGVCSKMGLGEYDKAKRNLKEFEIYNDLPIKVFKAEYSADDESGNKLENSGMGIFLNGNYISCNHISNSLRRTAIMSPFGLMEIPIEITNLTCKVNDQKLEILVQDENNDLFIAKSKYADNLCDFPFTPRTKVRYGEEVYLIGNPALTGTNIRRGRITDLNGYGDESKIKDAFGTDINLTPGDSGTPLVSIDGNLLGIAQFTNSFGLSYFIRIEKFLKKMKGGKK